MKKLSKHILEANNILELNNITIKYDKAVAVRNTNMFVKEKFITSLIGANGAGKTTILKSILGLLKPAQGQIYFSGKRIDGKISSDIVAKGIALVPEGRRLFPEMTVLENLELGGYSCKSEKIIERNLKRVLTFFPDLKPKLSQAARELSGGQQQMVAIGRALMSDPKLLILDEPSIGLAPIVVEEIEEVIKNINETEGVSVLLVEQDAHSALELSHYGFVLQTGEVQKEGFSEDLLQDKEIRQAYLGI